MEQYESQQYRGCTINIGFDGDSESPREWDNVATFVCKHPHYSLGDKQNVKGVVEDLFSDHVTDKAIIDFFIKNRNAEYIPGEEDDDSDHYYKFTEIYCKESHDRYIDADSSRTESEIAEDLTEEQINAFGDFLEQNGSEDTVYTDTEINDMFCHDSDYVYSIVGWPGYPKVFKITHPDGRSVDVLVRSENEEQDLKGSLNVSSMTEIESAGDGDEDVEFEDFEEEEFESIKFWKITGPFGNTAIVKTENDIDSDGLHNDEFMQCCKIEQLSSNQEDYIDWLDFYTDDFTWNPEGKLLDECYIPVYAIPRICEKILNPDGSLDYYDIPESHAINMMNLNLELNDEDIKNIDGFVNNLNKKYPDGFDIKWDEPSIGSPYFDSKPEFGLACDCVTLRIYKK